MMKRIAIIDGHPDPDPGRFCHAISAAYAEGAKRAGHDVERIDIALIDFPLLRGKSEWETGAVPPAIRDCQQAIARADHIAIVFPLWLGGMPALLKAFLEQALRPGFAIGKDRMSLRPGLLTGKTSRIVVTMGMPALLYRWFFFAHGLRNLRRNILRFCGIGKIRTTLIGAIEGRSADDRDRLLETIREMGRRGE